MCKFEYSDRNLKREMLFSKIVSLAVVAAVIVHDGGILEVEDGVIYQVERVRKHYFRVQRANPIESYANLSFADCSRLNCMNNFDGNRREQRNCDDGNEV